MREFLAERVQQLEAALAEKDRLIEAAVSQVETWKAAWEELNERNKQLEAAFARATHGESLRHTKPK